jgi:hypothetical protein
MDLDYLEISAYKTAFNRAAVIFYFNSVGCHWRKGV